MQELKIHDWCDACLKRDGSYVEAADSFWAVIDDDQAPATAAELRRIDLCEPDGKVFREAQDMLRTMGNVVKRVKSRGGGHPLLPSPPVTVAKSEQPTLPTLPEPLTKLDRKAKQREAERRWSLVNAECPIPTCAKSMTRGSLHKHLVVQHGCVTPKQPPKCPDCGGRYAKSFAMITHRRRMHDYLHIAEIAATAKS